jgi:hypothetical protein
MEIGATTAPENEAAVRAALQAVVDRLRSGTIAAPELERARAEVAGRRALSADGLGPRAAALAFAELAGGVPADLGRVTVERVREVLGRAWPAGSERVAIAGPPPPAATTAAP